MGCQDRVACRCAQEVRELLPDPAVLSKETRHGLSKDLPWARGLRIDLYWDAGR
jgi:hypothetical protein